MKAYGVLRRIRCCPGHDADSKKFDRAAGSQFRPSAGQKAIYREQKRRARREGKKEVENGPVE